tara:strand:+ start:268 stop:654 length:387 start_codon:yes stop_codon:yes gene_type:complete
MKRGYSLLVCVVFFFLALSFVSAGKCRSCDDVYDDHDHRVIYKYDYKHPSHWDYEDFDDYCDDHWNKDCRDWKKYENWKEDHRWDHKHHPHYKHVHKHHKHGHSTNHLIIKTPPKHKGHRFFIFWSED